ncbi:MAG: Rieske (2Fe-2S) protein [Thermoleophilia bacterium]|nr:Rieske (2Fe-2S) protein [Thermoleophilia bacterium]MDH3724599.1 Rieske (2Fe-2S) protein [Thermoleophilia bacterium]
MPEKNDLDDATAPYSGPRAVDPGEPEPRLEDDPDYVTRTRFLSLIALAGGVAMTAAIVVPVVGFAVAPTLEPEPPRWVDVGPLKDFPDGETTSIAVAGPATESDRRVFIRRRDDELIPIWNRCAHLGCPVAYSPGGDVFACPCHGGAYNSRGLVTAGPPARPLDRLDYKIVTPDGKDVALGDAKDEDRLLIGVAYSIDEDEQSFTLRGPGESVTGVLRNLYPSPGA